ncbi:MAG: hypothetical protein AAF322_13250 [Pseudomonadota bacterium]
MLTKFLIFLAVVIGVFVVARLGASSALKPAGRARRSTARVRRAEETLPCPNCGSYVVIGEICSCAEKRRS